MPIQNNQIIALDIQNLLNGEDRYEIPIYQRNYAWEAKEIEQLIQDIIDYSIHHKNKNYYIGTLVVAAEKTNNEEYFNTIDGQQRLTTLSILSSVIKNRHKEIDLDWYQNLNLKFKSREKSMLSLKAAFTGKFENQKYEVNIQAAYDICSKELVKKTKENGITIKEFADYLYTYVKILRVPLPDGLDLNHYFEIMNSRGEQLEKHEILKAKLMSCFNNIPNREAYLACFDLIWSACSNMEKYVQYGFTVVQRHLIFGENDWNNLCVYSFDDFLTKVKLTDTNPVTVELGIDEIIRQSPSDIKNEENDDSPDRFKNESERVDFVKEYIYNLLKCKFLFDKYVIKREFTAGNDKWSLQSLKWYSSGKTKNGVQYKNSFGEDNIESYDNDNRKILMLLSMFHVSIPSMSYKYWLNASMNYLFQQLDVDSKDYISYLENIAKSFVFDRHLAKIPIGYDKMIFENLSPIKRNVDQLDLSKLQYGNIENNLIFNFCDYLLWIKYKDLEKDQRVKSFEYTFRSSVEHFYPQTPINNDLDKIEDKYLHSFGNLCLISHEKNSRLNNHSPLAKKDHYSKGISLDSLKQYLMMKYNNWGIDEIEEHNKFMINLLMENTNSDYKFQNEVSVARKWFKEFQVKDKNLLVRALLCFDDCAKHISGSKYNLFDFEYIRNHNAFKLFEEYVEQNSPKNLSEIIDKQLANEKLKTDSMYLFIKYPEVIEYCKEGNFQWIEELDGVLIHLLESDKRTTNKAREAITFILYNILKEKINLYIDYEGLWINIEYVDGSYLVTKNRSDLQIQIWNDEGKVLHHQIEPLANGNTKAVKLLEDFKWEKHDGNYYRFGNSKLLKLSNNFEENILNAVEGIKKLFKNGLNIIV